MKTLTRKSGDRIFNLFADSGVELFPTVFISYAREDRRAAEQVVDFLLSEGVKVWVDYLNIRPGEKWAEAIAYAIPRARYFLVLLSNHSLSKKGFVQKEVKTAWEVAEEDPDNEIFVIPARLEDCKIQYTKFSKLNCVDLFPNPETGLKTLVDSLADGP